MRRPWIALTAGVAALALVPALAQQGPESILPPGFDAPAPAPPPGEQPPNSMATATPPEELPVEEALANELAANVTEAELPPIDMPPAAARSTEQVGFDEGFAASAFGNADGRFLVGLMRRIEVPIASRWTAIMLRRALVSRTATPPGIAPVDWIAERALLLAKLGNADDARALVAAVDSGNYTPRMYDAAMQAALATADPAALCGVADAAVVQTRLPSWALARAYCAGLAGEGASANAALEEIRREGRAGGVDVRLAEKVAAVGGGARRSVSIEWDGVERLNAWRFGLAAATAVPIPPALFGTVGGQVQAWLARAPLYPLAARAVAAERAATLGALSSTGLVDFYGALWDASDGEERGGSVAETLRTAYAGSTVDARLAALQQLWSGGSGWTGPYARYILTARAAGAIPVRDVPALDGLVAAMFAAGLDIQAERWADRAESGTLAWALLAVGSPRPPFAIDRASAAEHANAPLLIASLTALGRLPASDPPTAADAWTRALDAAVVAREPGTVALLAAAAMQTPYWRGVPVDRLARILTALRAVGLEPEARMIAAEALTRT